MMDWVDREEPSGKREAGAAKHGGWAALPCSPCPAAEPRVLACAAGADSSLGQEHRAGSSQGGARAGAGRWEVAHESFNARIVGASRVADVAIIRFSRQRDRRPVQRIDPRCVLQWSDAALDPRAAHMGPDTICCPVHTSNDDIRCVSATRGRRLNTRGGSQPLFEISQGCGGNTRRARMEHATFEQPLSGLVGDKKCARPWLAGPGNRRGRKPILFRIPDAGLCRQLDGRRQLGARAKMLSVAVQVVMMAAMVTAFGTPHEIEVISQPVNTAARQELNVLPSVLHPSVLHPSVQVRDADRNLVGNETQIRVTPTGTTQPLSGTTEMFTTNGRADFTDLAFMQPAAGIRLTFSCQSCENAQGPQIQKNSSAFSVLPAVEHLRFTAPSPGNRSYKHRVVAGENIRPCQVGTRCFNYTVDLPSYCEKADDIDNRAIAQCFSFPEDICTNQTWYQGRLDCKECQNCFTREEFLQIGQYDSTGALVHDSRLPITAELEVIEASQAGEAKLAGVIVPQSCCQAKYCSFVAGTCCNCSNPVCALCAFPVQGKASFPRLSINKVGTYRIKFSTTQYQHDEGDITKEKVIVQFKEPASSVIFSVGPGPAAKLKVQEQPSVVELKFAREPQVLDVQPRVIFMDQVGNPGVDMGAGILVAQLCKANEIANAPNLCPCDQLERQGGNSCVGEKLTESVAVANQTLSGDVTTYFKDGSAVFTDLKVHVSSSELRLVFQWFSTDPADSNGDEFVYRGIYVASSPFEVAAGALDRMALKTQPNTTSGCLRCPAGIHLSGSSMHAEVEMLDVFGNRITQCKSRGEWCHGVPSVTVTVRLQEVKKVSGFLTNVHQDNGLLLAQEGGQVEANATFGIANFTNIRSRVVGRYVVEFKVNVSTTVTASSMPVRFSANVSSEPFNVVSAAPTRVLAYEDQDVLRGVDMELLRTQPKFQLLDAMGNLVVSDCYTDCGGILTKRCSETSSECPTKLFSKLKESSATLYGDETVDFLRGMATFRNLSLKIEPTPVCQSAGISQNFTLELRAEALGSDNCSRSTSCVYQRLAIREPVQKLSIFRQPQNVLAQETFLDPIEVRIRGCDISTVLKDVNAFVRASIADNAGGDGTLLGQKLVPISGGKAIFTDLAISAYGKGYTLMFSFRGRNGKVSDVKSDTFEVKEAAAKIDFVAGRDLGDSRTRAGVPFETQPQIKILGTNSEILKESTAEVTAKLETNPGKEQAHDPTASISAVLHGTLVVRAGNLGADGICGFTDLYITKANVAQGVKGRFSIIFLTGQLRISSQGFDILPTPNVHDIVLFKQPTNGEAGLSLGSFLLYLVDEFKNRLDSKDLVNRSITVHAQKEGGPSGATLLINNEAEEVLIPNSDPPALTRCLSCQGTRPTACSNFKTVKRCHEIQQDGSSGMVEFTNLRIDKAGKGYYLRFEIVLNLTTNKVISSSSAAFEVLNNNPLFPQIMGEYRLPSTNPADSPFAVQPRVLAFDKFGNPVVVDSLQGRTVSVRLATQGGLSPVAPPLPQVLPPGQEDRTICSIHQENLVGTTKVLVDTQSGQGVFTNLAVRQVMKNYQLEFTMTSSQGDLVAKSPQFDVVPGQTKGICNMSLPSGFSEKSPQLLHSNIVCVDEFGNVQPTCQTCFGKDCGYSPMNVGDYFTVDCPSKICVKLYRGPRGLCKPFAPDGFDCGVKLSSLSLGSTDCSAKFCGVDLDASSGSPAGFAFFTDLQISEIGVGYQLKFYTNVGYVKKQEKYEWSYITPPFDVLPAAPSIQSVKFTPTLAQIEILFNKNTNMNGFGRSRWSIDCKSEFDESFLKTLGDSPSCIWTSRSLLQISLGKNSFVTQTSEVRLLEGSDITSTEMAQGKLMTSLPASTTEGRIVGGVATPKYFPDFPAKTPDPVARLLGPLKLGACDKIRADTGLSSGFGGRTYDYVKWNVDLSKSELQNGLLESAGLVSTFQERRIHFSSVILGDENVVTVTLRPVSKLPAGTNITIAGLPTDTGFHQPCPTYEVPSVFAACTAADGYCSMTPLEGPGKDIFHRVDFGSKAGGPCTAASERCLPAAQSKGDALYLTIREGSFMDDAQDTVFRIRLRNPLDPRVREDLSLSAKCEKCFCLDETCTERGNVRIDPQGMSILCKRVCPSGDEGIAHVIFPDHPIKVLSGSVSESSQTAGTMNTITLMLQTSHPFGAGAEIHIWGFESFVTKGLKCAFGRDGVSMACKTCGNGTSNTVRIAEDKHLIFVVRNGTRVHHPNLKVALSIRLKNSNTPGVGVTARANIKYSRITDETPMPRDFARTAVPLSGIVLSGKSIPAILTFDVTESNKLKGAKNWIKMSFVANLDLPFSTKVSVSGFPVNSNVDAFDNQIPLWSQDGIHLCFCNENGTKGFAAWHGLNRSTLVFTVASDCEIPSLFRVTVAFKIQNPMSSGIGSVLALMASNDGCVGCNQAYCACAADDIYNFSTMVKESGRAVLAATSDAYFKRLKISEGNTIAGELNTISVALTPGIDLLNGTVIMLTGLNATSTASTQIEVFSEDETRPARLAHFDPVAGVLTVTWNDRDVYPQHHETIIRFELRNPNSMPSNKPVIGVKTKAVINICGSNRTQPCPFAGIDSLADMDFPLQDFTGTVFGLGGEPMLIRSHIRESNRVFGALNLIMVGLELNFNIIAGTKISVSGLMNSETQNADGLTAVKELAHLFPNCSCACQASSNCNGGCDSCTVENEIDLRNQFRIWQPQDLFGSSEYSENGLHPSGKTVTGSWEVGTGTLILQLADNKTFPPNTLLEFAFILSNARSPVSSSLAQVSLSGGSMVKRMEPTDLDQRVMGAAVPARLSVAAVKETTYVDGGFAEFEVTLESNCPLVSPRSPGTQIMMYGLNVFEDESQYLPLSGQDRYDIAKSGITYWDRDYGRVSFAGSFLVGGCESLNTISTIVGWSSNCALDVKPGLIKKKIIFNFSLKKEAFQVVDPSKVGFEVQGMITLAMQQPTSVILSPRDLPSAKFIVSSIEEASQGFGSSNAITVNVRLNADLSATSILTITGLVGTLTLDGSLELRGPDAKLFGMQGNWTQGTGTLLVVAKDRARANRDLRFTFALGNALKARAWFAPPVRPKISGSLRNVGTPLVTSIDETFMTLIAADILSPKVSPIFSHRTISVTNQVKYAVSIVTVSLRANVALTPGALITILGLKSSTVPGNLALSGPNRDLFEEFAKWTSDHKLVITVAQRLDSNLIFTFSLSMQNKGSQDSSSVQVSASGGPSGELSIEPQLLKGRPLDGSAELSWLIKSAHETTRVAGQINAVSFTIKPNAPMYEGSKLTISGLAGLNTKVCMICQGIYDLVPGLGCAYECTKCTAGETCLPVFKQLPSIAGGSMQQPVTVLFETNPGTQDGLGSWDPETGSLILTVASGQVLSAANETIFTLMLRNSKSKKAKAECGLSSTMSDIAEGKCLTVNASSVSLCDPNGPLGTNCGDGSTIPLTSIEVNKVPVDAFNAPLFDTCPVCVRNEDLVALDSSLSSISGYSIVEHSVYPPSLRGQPTLIADGAAIGTYFMVVTVANWVGNTAQDVYTFSKERGLDGPLGAESFKPQLFFHGPTSRQQFVNRGLELFVTGQAALCQDDYAFEYLTYSWKISKCIGTCSVDKTCTDKMSTHGISSSNSSRFIYIAPNSLSAGQDFQITATAIQQRDPANERLKAGELKVSAQVCVSTLIRAVVPVISGAGSFVSTNSDVVLHARNSFDPECATTKAYSQNFAQQWTCRRFKPTPENRQCAIDSDATFSGCSISYFDQNCPSTMYSTDSKMLSLTLDKQSLFRDIIGAEEFGQYLYLITVTVWRNLETLSDEISTNPRFQDASQSNARRSTSIMFAVRKGSFMPIRVIRCDSSRLGFSDLCVSPDPAIRVGNRQKIVLHAGYSTNPMQDLGEANPVLWNTSSELGDHFLTPRNVLSSVHAQFLIIKPGSILPGQRVWFRATITAANTIGFAEVEVHVNVPPIGGFVEVKPTSGLAAITDFTIGTRGWTSDHDSLPYSYSFHVHIHNPDLPSTRFPISVGEMNVLTDKLPPGDPATGSRLRIDVRAIDIWGSDAEISTNVTVTLPTLNDPEKVQRDVLEPYLTKIRKDQDQFLMPPALAVAAGSLNALADFCASAASAVVPAQPSGVQPLGASNMSACPSSSTHRRQVRHEMLGDLFNLSLAAPISAKNLNIQASLLWLIVGRPDELSVQSADLALNIFRQVRSNGLYVDEDISDAVHALGYVFSRLMDAIKALQTPVATIRRQSLQRPVHRFSRHDNVRVLAQDENTMRRLTTSMLKDLSGLSALSLKSAHAGEAPSATINDAFVMMSWRVKSKSISTDQSSFEMQGVKVTIPTNIFSNLQTKLASNVDVDVMLIVWTPTSNPVPHAGNSLVGIELRAARSESPLPFKFPMTDAVTLKLAQSSNISQQVNPLTGKGFTPSVQRFNLEGWGWTREHITTLSVHESSIQAATTHLSFFSTLPVETGCDGVALSLKKNDACKVCGGDNTTCSGCDGIPNTGRDRKCSGHGQCGFDRCSCNSGWFGITCQNFCRDQTTCSGHGRCNPDHGASCQCDTNWFNTIMASETSKGPFCSRMNTTISSTAVKGELGAFLVKMAVSLPMSKAAFGVDKQRLFTSAVAAAAGVPDSVVSIDKIEDMASRRRAARRLLAQSIRIDLSIQARDRASADSLLPKLTASRINSELAKVGLPKATVIEDAKTVARDTGPSKASFKLILATSIPTGVFVLVVVIAVWFYVTRQQRAAAALRKAILDFGQSHSHLESGIHKQIAKVDLKAKLEKISESRSENAALIVPSEAEEDTEKDAHAERDVKAVASLDFSYGPSSGYLATAVASTSKTNAGQISFERIDRRARAMHGSWKSRLKKRQTVEKYKMFAGPKGDVCEDQEDSDREDVEESMMKIEAGSCSDQPRKRDSWHITDEPEWLSDESDGSSNGDEVAI